jgi:hypothetical protein
MPSKYEDAVAAATKLISEAVLAREDDLVHQARDVDRIVLGIVREVGRSAAEQVLNTTAVAESKRVASREGLTPQHRERTPFLPSSEKSKSSRRTSGTRRRK